MLESNAVIDGDTSLGRGNRVFPFSSIGLVPQDLKFRGEAARVEIGDRNTFREGTTVHRGTAGGGSLTRIGSDNLFMAQVHIAHDCQVGSHTIFANVAALAGHVEVHDYATVGAYSAVHQFCRVGTHAFMGGATVAVRDVLPYSLTVGNRAHLYGANTVGLRRRGFSSEAIAALRRAFHVAEPSPATRPRAPSTSCGRKDRSRPRSRRWSPSCGRRSGASSSRGARAHPAPGPIPSPEGHMPGEPLGLIAGNGRFPFLAARGARGAGRRVVALAIREEADPALEREVDEFHWVGLGQLGRGIDIMRRAGAREAVMAGQVKHRQIFSDIVPDLKLMGLLARLAFKNTDSLIGAVADALARDGITLLPSVAFLESELATPGPMTRRRPSRDERRDIAYGERVARVLAGMDLGQTAVVKDRAAVALEAMEGTDETIRRAGRIAGAGTTVVKVAKPRQDMRFDVPVVGPGTLEAMAEAKARVLALDARRTLLIDRAEFLVRADAAGISVFGLSGEAEAAEGAGDE